MNNTEKPKKKKGCGCLTAVVVFVVAFIGALAIIGGSGEDEEKIIPPEEVGTQQTETSADNTSRETEITEGIGAKNTESVGEIVLLDDKGVKITAKSLDKSGWLGPELKILIENNAGKTLNVQVRDASVNGYMTDATLFENVADGKKVNSSITFLSTDLKRAGIETIAEMEFEFRIINEDLSEYLESEPIIVKTTAAETYNYTHDMPGNVIYDVDGIKIVYSGSTTNDWIGEGVLFYAYNGSDKSVTITDRDASVNGLMIDPIFRFEIEPGKYAVENMTFTSSELNENDIDNITDVEFYLHITESGTINTVSDSEIIALKFD